MVAIPLDYCISLAVNQSKYSKLFSEIYFNMLLLLTVCILYFVGVSKSKKQSGVSRKRIHWHTKLLLREDIKRAGGSIWMEVPTFSIPTAKFSAIQKADE